MKPSIFTSTFSDKNTIDSEMAHDKCYIILLFVSILRSQFYIDIIIVGQNISRRSSEAAERETFEEQPAPKQSIAQRVG